MTAAATSAGSGPPGRQKCAASFIVTGSPGLLPAGVAVHWQLCCQLRCWFAKLDARGLVIEHRGAGQQREQSRQQSCRELLVGAVDLEVAVVMPGVPDSRSAQPLKPVLIPAAYPYGQCEFVSAEPGKVIAQVHDVDLVQAPPGEQSAQIGPPGRCGPLRAAPSS
jgi:hypothetical protein